MGKATGFLDYERTDNLEIEIEKRIKNYDEFHSTIDENERVKQAGRCMDCGVPFCQSALSIKGRVVGCPIHNLIPETNDAIYQGQVEHALSRLLKTNNFPEFTSRVCPALCEKACLEGMNGDPVTIHDNENYIIETAYAHHLIKPRIPTVQSHKKVAIIGSGPSGLATADMLNQRGHTVDVYEKEDAIGGLLMYGIPNMKLDKKVIERRVKIMKKEGIHFILNTDVGKDITLEELKKKYDAVIMCIGSKKPRGLNVDMNTKGVYYAVDYLTSQTKSLYQNTKPISAKGKKVLVVGGGDTGNDCIGTAIRQGATSITQLEMMSEPPTSRLPSNPWPEWTNVKKTDYGVSEAIHVLKKDPRIYESTVKSIETKNGQLTSVTIVKVKFNNGKLEEVKGSEQTIKCDLLLIAAGFVGVEDYMSKLLPVTNRNTIQTDHHYNVKDNLFACGDARRGQSLVVWAISEGRQCAINVDQYLMGYTTMK